MRQSLLYLPWPQWAVWCNLTFTWTVALPIFVTSDQFCQAVHPILPGSPTDFWDRNFPISPSDFVQFVSDCMSKTSNETLYKSVDFFVHGFIESFIWNLWLTIRHELHKIRQRDRKIPISKIGQRAWQNQTDSKNWTNFGCSCKWGVM